MIPFMRFFYKGPGLALVIVGAIIGVGWAIKQSREKVDAEAQKRQKTRELGQVSPKDNVDASQASREAVLSNRKLSPGFTTASDTAQIPNVPVSAPGRPAALPTLVFFYAHVSATPSPTP